MGTLESGSGPSASRDEPFIRALLERAACSCEASQESGTEGGHGVEREQQRARVGSGTRNCLCVCPEVSVSVSAAA